MDEETTGRAVKPHGPWTADTERAFLLALKLTGQPKKAAAEIGRSANAAYTRRKREPGFAARWDAAIAEQQAAWIAETQARLGPGLDAAGGGRLTPGREYVDGWDEPKRGLFLRTLARTKCVSEACAAAGMSTSAAYYLRGQAPRFAAAWEKALRDNAPSVIDAAYARAVEGWDEPIVQGGKVVGHRKRYSEGLLRDLLKRDAPVAPTPDEVAAGRATEAELNEAILKNLAILDARIQQEEAETQAAHWERGRRMWGAWGAPERVSEADREAGETLWAELERGAEWEDEEEDAED